MRIVYNQWDVGQLPILNQSSTLLHLVPRKGWVQGERRRKSRLVPTNEFNYMADRIYRREGQRHLVLHLHAVPRKRFKRWITEKARALPPGGYLDVGLLPAGTDNEYVCVTVMHCTRYPLPKSDKDYAPARAQGPTLQVGGNADNDGGKLAAMVMAAQHWPIGWRNYTGLPDRIKR